MSKFMIEIKPRHVTSSSTGRRVLFSAFEHDVVMYDFLQGSLSETIHTIFDFGGKRLALSDELDGIVAAAYQIHGLAFYSSQTRKMVWQRKDIKKIQRVTLSRDGLKAYCGIEGSALKAIDLNSGQTLFTVRGAKSIHESQFDKIQLIDLKRPYLLDETGQRQFSIDRTTFAFLDVVFAPGLLCLSEAGGPVRCFDLATGRELWRYIPLRGSHVLRLGYREGEPYLLGIEWSYQNNDSMKMLRLSLDGGVLQETLDLGNTYECCFTLAGKKAVTTDGKLFDTLTGRLDKQLIIHA